MSSTEEQVKALGRRWADAEVRGDTETLGALVTDGFRLVGPVGFVLDRLQWLARHRTGELVTKSLDWHDVEVREFGGTAIAIGVHEQTASFKGTPVDGRFRATHVLVREGGEWRLAGIHLSAIGGPPPFTAAGKGAA
ncbi:nuclear transport factor 2 family protein [Amycolatopsis sp. NPDC049252]|uniref:nuclear transport factor 2 family protein n=1 Tax=Amycolatopsis sp. NPDC049252 TaxID=3363933 RepID=UPI00372036A3